MRLTFLGTGTSQGVPVIACTCEVCRSTDPRDNRTRSAAVVEVEGKRILIDAGPELRIQLLREQVMDLDAVLLTHEHMDHIAGLDDLRAFSLVHEPPRPTDIHTNQATVDAVRRVFSYAFAERKYPGVPEYAMHVVGHGPFRAAGVEVVPIEVKHLHMLVLGYRIGGLVYITDAKTIAPAEREKIKGADVLVLNALRRKEHLSHLNLDEALALIEELRPRRAYLTHISHWMGLHADVHLPDGVELAYDGLKVDL